MPRRRPPVERLAHADAARMIAAGFQLTPAGLYEPDHAPPGTVFVVLVAPNGRDTLGLYRVRPPVPRNPV